MAITFQSLRRPLSCSGLYLHHFIVRFYVICLRRGNHLSGVWVPEWSGVLLVWIKNRQTHRSTGQKDLDLCFWSSLKKTYVCLAVHHQGGRRKEFKYNKYTTCSYSEEKDREDTCTSKCVNQRGGKWSKPVKAIQTLRGHNMHKGSLREPGEVTNTPAENKIDITDRYVST